MPTANDQDTVADVDQTSAPPSPARPPTDPVGPAPQPGRQAPVPIPGAAQSTRPHAPSARAGDRSNSVSIVGDTFAAFGFSPRSITVKVGDRVRWHNESNASEGHTVTGDGLDSGTFHQGEDYAHTFSRAGTYKYICALHPSMKGKVAVLASRRGGSNAGGGSSGGGGSSAASGSGSGGGTTSGSGGGSSVGDPGSSGQLPVTGLALLPLGVIGIALVIGGVLLRRAELYYY